MANYYTEKSKISINELIENNLDLVKKIAWQIFGRVHRVVEVEDLIQQGMEGLVSAAQKYSPIIKIPRSTVLEYSYKT